MLDKLTNEGTPHNCARVALRLAVALLGTRADRQVARELDAALRRDVHCAARVMVGRIREAARLMHRA